MKLLFLDFETYYDTEYSLRRMTPPEYIMHPQFEMIMCSWAFDNDPPQILESEIELVRFLKELNPAEITVVCYNALFDSAILSWRYKFIPKRTLDVLAMARTFLSSKLASFSLANVAEYFKLEAKGSAIEDVKGLNSLAIRQRGLWGKFTSYCMHDLNLCRQIFFNLLPQFPPAERVVMDLVLRCCLEPAFLIDQPMLTKHIENLKLEKENLLNSAGVQKKELMSNPKFQKLLEDLGVEIDYKTSSLTGKPTPAFAKTDKFLQDLQEHEDPRVQNLVAARLGLKSTIEETRSLKFLKISSLMGGYLPVPLGYGGAHTHRLSGQWKLNLQNLPTELRSGGRSRLRRALIAPPGYKVVVADLGQIEARLVAYVCNCQKLLQQFRDKLDPYAKLASKIFRFEVNRKVHLAEGFIGKTGILGCGYGCGPYKFYNMVSQQAKIFKVDVSEIWTLELAQESVHAYRREYPEIPAGWRTLDQILALHWCGTGGLKKFGPVEIGYGVVHLPNGMQLDYNEPTRNSVTGEFSYRDGKTTYHLYGAKTLEHICQSLARIVVMEAAVRIYLKYRLQFRIQAHDELGYIVPQDQVEQAKQVIHEEMVREPIWAPGLPLTADIGIGDSYGEAK